MNDIGREDRIDRYLLGNMTAEEAKAMEKDMEADKQLAKDVETTRIIIERMRAMEENKRLMAQWEEEYQASKTQEKDGSEQGQEGPRIGKNRFRWTLTIVSGLAACIVAGFFLWNNLPSTEPGKPATRGMEGAGFKYVNTLIDEGKYDEAIDIIDRALADTIIDTTLPEEKQVEMRKEKAEERKMLIQLKQKAMEGKGK